MVGMVSSEIEARRVQRFGRSTLMVSLPAEWVKEIGLKPGDTVTITIDEDKSLRIYPAFTKVEKERKMTLRISKYTKSSLIDKCLETAYNLGYDVIVVEVVDGYLEEDQLKTLRGFVKELIGAEIIDHTPSRVTIQIFVDPTKHPISGIISRMTNLIKYMIQYLGHLISERKAHFVDEILELRRELIRFYMLSMRQTFLGQIDRGYARMLEVKSYMLPRYRSIARSLDLIGEAIANIAIYIKNLDPKEFDEVSRKISDLKELLDLFQVSLERSIENIEKANVIEAYNTLSLGEEFYNHVTRFIEKHLKEDSCKPYYQTIREIIEILRRSSMDLKVITSVGFDLAVERAGGNIDLSSGEAIKIV